LNDNFEKAGELKNLLNQREEENFCSLACFSNTAQRRYKEKFTEKEYRQAFSADSDRILNSLAFTRYIDKTQVFSLINNDHLTHRVIHVQLVSRIGRTIGRYLVLKLQVLGTISGIHPLGMMVNVSFQSLPMNRGRVISIIIFKASSFWIKSKKKAKD